MVDFNGANIDLAGINQYLQSKGIGLSDNDKSTLNTIFKACDTYNDVDKKEGQDGKLNRNEWQKFINEITNKLPKILHHIQDANFNFGIRTNQRASIEMPQDNTYIAPKLVAPNDKTRVERPVIPDIQETRAMIATNVEGFSDKYDELIVKYAKEFNLDPNLVKAVIKKESRFNPRALSLDKKHKGLMQVSSVYVRGNLYDPETNIREGCRLLRSSLDTFDGDVSKALMGYNRGEGGAKKAIRKGKNPDNDTYVKLTLGYYNELNQNIA